MDRKRRPGSRGLKCIEVEEAVARMFGIRAHFAIVPNIASGLWIHECDLLVIRKSGHAIEVEIKVSKADLKKDAAKRHGHIDRQNRIKELYFAVPKPLYEDAVEHAPDRAGIITIEPYVWHSGREALVGRVRRKPTINKAARPLSEKEMLTVARLGAMRIWGLKAKLIKANASHQKAI